MNNKSAFLVVIVLAILTFSSCKTHERCPAYGKMDIKNSNTIPA
jgi:hypothetical protein